MYSKNVRLKSFEIIYQFTTFKEIGRIQSVHLWTLIPGKTKAKKLLYVTFAKLVQFRLVAPSKFTQCARVLSLYRSLCMVLPESRNCTDFNVI